MPRYSQCPPKEESRILIITNVLHFVWIVLHASPAKLDKWAEDGSAGLTRRSEGLVRRNNEKPNPESSSKERSKLTRQVSGHGTKNAEKPPTPKYERIKQTLLDLLFGEQKPAEQKPAEIYSGSLRIKIVKGLNISVKGKAIRHPYVIVTLGCQTKKTKVAERRFCPVWNQSLMLDIPDPIPPLKLEMYNQDPFVWDDNLGAVEIDIRPLVRAAKKYENGSYLGVIEEYGGGRRLLGTVREQPGNPFSRLSDIWWVEGRVQQEMTVGFKNSVWGELQIELEYVPPAQ